jgi:hypothetical protein
VRLAQRQVAHGVKRTLASRVTEGFETPGLRTASKLLSYRADFGERWMSVSNPPPLSPMRTVSPAPAGLKMLNNAGLFPQSS